MKKLVVLFAFLLLISSISYSQMQLKLDSSEGVYYSDKSLAGLNATLPAYIPPMDEISFYKGMWMLGIMADVSFPLGGDEDFGHIAGTGISGHAMIGYILADSWLVALRGGYIKFAEQTTNGNEFGADYTWKDNYNQIPIFIGGYYLFNTSGAFKPYIGVALGLIIQNYKFDGTYTYEIGGQTYTDTETADKSSTGFGVAPSLGCYLALGSVMLNLAVEYNILFGGLELTADDFTYNSQYFGTRSLEKVNNITQDEVGNYSESYNISQFSVLFGVSIPLSK